MGLIDDLVAEARERARTLPKSGSESESESESKSSGPSFREALRGKGQLQVIAEFKTRSPSLGPIAERDLEAQVRRYQNAGAAAVSVLTEPSRFGGSLSDLSRAAAVLDVPVLMKDFVVDPAQVREAARRGASAVLLIVRCVSKADLDELVSSCDHYGVTPLVECHSIDEVDRAASFGSSVIGVNNRDLDTLEIDRRLAPRLLREIPRERVAVAESGYQEAEDVVGLRGLADAVLVGSALMKHPDPAALIGSVMKDDRG
jgi:indole-3-glycerol phosphate synthase